VCGIRLWVGEGTDVRIKHVSHTIVALGNLSVILDLIITHRDCQPVSCTVKPAGLISDHSLFICHFLSAPYAVKSLSSIMRPWKLLDNNAFISLLESLILYTDVSKLRKYSVEDLFNFYDNTICHIGDEHVPVYTASVHDRRVISWFGDECRSSSSIENV